MVLWIGVEPVQQEALLVLKVEVGSARRVDWEKRSCCCSTEVVELEEACS